MPVQGANYILSLQSKSKRNQADFEAHLAKMQMEIKYKPAALNNEFNKI